MDGKRLLHSLWLENLLSYGPEGVQEASQRTQIIVKTHSDLLVSEFSDQPEAVVVCERTPNGTTLERLEAKALEGWLEEYSLGDVWMRGALGERAGDAYRVPYRGRHQQ